jgi:hypothetical protein
MRAIQLILHAEVSYVSGQGLGIGIVQQAELVVEDGARKPRAGISVSPTKEKKYSIKGEFFTAKNVETKERAYMLALQHALGMAKSVIKKNGTKEGSNVAEVKIAIPSPAVVETVNYHIQNSPESLKHVKKMNDRVMIERVVRSVKKVFRRGVNVSISLADGHDTKVARAKTLARQKGSKACKSRRQRNRAQNDDTTETPDETEILAGNPSDPHGEVVLQQ